MAAPSIPPELWSHIFQFQSTVDEATDSSSDAWANIVTANPKCMYVPSRSVIECNKAKRAVGLVCKDFYKLSRPVVLETITLWNTSSFRYLARQIRKRPEFVRMMERYTRRIDVRLSLLDMLRLDCRGLGDIVKLSQNLTWLMLPWHWQHHFLTNTTVDPCTLLEVMICYPRGRVDFRPGFAPNRFSKLHVLDMGLDCLTPPYELPLLHTLIGSLDAISHFVGTRLPSLRTLICRHNGWSSSSFFQAHGKRIESLDMKGRAHFFDHGIQEFLPNVKELVIDIQDDDVVAGPMCLNVQKLGIYGFYSREDTAGLVLRRLDSIVRQREQGNFQNLKTICILVDETTRLLCEQKRMATQRRARRMRKWSIRLEDGHGDLLLPPSSSQNFFQSSTMALRRMSCVFAST